MEDDWEVRRMYFVLFFFIVDIDMDRYCV
jgi:hypothetical protein